MTYNIPELVTIYEFKNGGRYHVEIGSISIMCDSIKSRTMFIELENDGVACTRLLTKLYKFEYKFLR